MSVTDRIKTQLDRKALRFLVAPIASSLARRRGAGVRRIFYDKGVWIHETSRGYFAYPSPYIRLNMEHLDEFARSTFLRGYQPREGDVIVDIGAGVGEETLTFSRAVGERGKVICVEAHPRTFQCLQKMVEYNRLANVIPVHMAITEPACAMTTIEDSDRYLRNRVGHASGIPVAGTTIDALVTRLSLERIDFLKMNIEGAERLAIRGMDETLRRTETICVCCHDFLAAASGDDRLRTKAIVNQYLSQAGRRVITQDQPDLPHYVRDQIWAYTPNSGIRAAG